jgi:cation:H+ antiporter
MDILYVLGGLAGLLAGGEYLVRGAVALAARLGISPLVIGLTIVGFGTSMPELVTSVQAAMIGAPGIAVGNVVGSNICNVLLILGLACVLSPIGVTRDGFWRDGGVLIAATVACVAVALSGRMGAAAGGVFLLGLAIYLLVTLRAARSTPAQQPANAAAGVLPGEGIATPPASMALSLIWLFGGILVTILAARYLVLGSVGLARSIGMSEAVIGLTIVAVGTSMPELITSVIAARRGQSEVALGNVIGSNLFNILGILGVTAVIRPLEIPAQIVTFDLWVMLAATLALVAVAVSGWRISRGEGGVLVAGYGLYLAVLLTQAPGS